MDKSSVNKIIQNLLKNKNTVFFKNIQHCSNLSINKKINKKILLIKY